MTAWPAVEAPAGGDDRNGTAWGEVEADLRKALVRARWRNVDQVLADLRPIFAAVERAHGRVEAELVWALLIVAADRMRRRAQLERARAAS